MPPKKNSAATNKQKGESYVKRTSFYTNVEWQPGCKPDQCTFIRGQMYVESLEPQKKTQKWPIVFIHGDFHSSQIWLTKPDGDPGWASFFVGKGFHVYLVDLPGSGKSNTLTKEAIANTEINSIKASQIEREITAPEVFNHISDPRWPTALKHDKWRGTGRRGDRIFDRYCASLTSLLFTIEERQTLAQNALKSLLKITGQAVLVGEGTGATASWLAADVAPQQVAGVVAVEPPGPPFCEGTVERNGKRKFDSFTSFNPDRLKYGLASIPLTFDPSPHPEPDLDEETAGLLPVALTQPDTSSNATPQRLHPLDLALFVEVGSGKRVVLQYSPENIPNGFVFSEKMTSGDGTMCIRKLTNLSKMRHVVITGEASSHSEYDTSTMHFMKQAGLSVDCGFLERYQTRGNGHLMFRETNSDEVASHIMRWIQTRAGKVDEPTNVVDLEEVTTVTPPLNLSPSQNYGVERQPFRSPKRGKWAVIDGPELAMPSTSSPQFIDLTDNPYNAISYCANDTPPAASAAGYPSPSVSKTTQTTQNTSLDQGCTLPDVSSAGLSNPVERSPPPLPQRNWRPASMSGQGELMCADAKIEVPEPSPRENKFVMPSVYAMQCNAPFVHPKESAQPNPQYVVPSQDKISSAAGLGSKRPHINHGRFAMGPEYSPRRSVRAALSEVTSSQAIPEQMGPRRNQLSPAGNQESEGLQSWHDSFYTNYRFDISAPQNISRAGDQATASSSQHVYDFTHMTSQQAAPLSQQTIPFPLSAGLDIFNWQENASFWPTQSEQPSSARTHAPRFMPDLRPSDDVTNVVEQFWEPSETVCESLSALPIDSGSHSQAHNDDDFDIYRYTF